jgi:spermidine/putrescine transport system permease protein
VGVGFSLWATLAAHIVLTLPFSFLIIGAALERFRFSLLEAARDLGASGPRAFVTITLPSILPAVLGAMLLAMAISIDEFVIAFFTAGPGNQTLPMLLYGRLNLGVTPSLNAVGTLLLLMTTGLALLSARATTRNTG